MIEFGSGHFGWPWHGLYRAATSDVTSPDGVVFDLVGHAPSLGDVLLLRVPGFPAPNTSPADSAAGMTWASWSFLSGVDRVVYGTNLGQTKHIYIDQVGDPWLIWLYLSGGRAAQEIGCHVYTKRFGLVTTEPDDWSDAGLFDVTFSLNPAYQYGAGALLPKVLDVAENGAAALLGVPREYGYAAISRLDFSGSPSDGSFAVTHQLVTDESQSDMWPASVTESSDYKWLTWRVAMSWGADRPRLPSGDLAPLEPGYFYADDGRLFACNGSDFAVEMTHSGGVSDTEPVDDYDGFDGLFRKEYILTGLHRSRQCRFVAGARFTGSASDTEVLHSVFDYTLDYSVAPVPAASDVTPVNTFTQRQFVIDGWSAEISESRTGSGGLVVGIRNSAVLQGFVSVFPGYPWRSSSVSALAQAAVNGQTAENVDITSSAADFTDPVLMLAGEPPLVPFPARLSNAVYTVAQHPVVVAAMAYDLATIQYGPAAGKIGIDNTYPSCDVSATDKPIFATENPLTGEVVRDTFPVCFM